MKVRYNTSTLIAGIGLVPWQRLGLERWFENYRIASLYGWDLSGTAGAVPVYPLAADANAMPVLPRLNTQCLLNDPGFQKILKENMAGYMFTTYKPVDAPKALTAAGHRFTRTDRQLAALLENKAEFRLRFADLRLPFPAFRIVAIDGLAPDKATLQDLLAGRERVVMQRETGSGGHGTFVVHDAASLERALSSMRRFASAKRAVVSDYIYPAFNRSVQCVVTRFGTFVGPLQKQLIAEPLLTSEDLDGSSVFCGGEISLADPLAPAYPAVRSYAMRIGDRIAAMGYRGIFGLDVLIDTDGRVFLLEINPRLTGMTPLLTALYRGEQDIPFFLLHTLETAGMDYSLDDTDVSDVPAAGGLMILHNRLPERIRAKTLPFSGLYGIGETKPAQRRHTFISGDTNEAVLVQQYKPAGFVTEPGGELLVMLTNTRITDPDDSLTVEATDTIRLFAAQITAGEAA